MSYLNKHSIYSVKVLDYSINQRLIEYLKSIKSLSKEFKVSVNYKQNCLLSPSKEYIIMANLPSNAPSNLKIGSSDTGMYRRNVNYISSAFEVLLTGDKEDAEEFMSKYRVVEELNDICKGNSTGVIKNSELFNL